MYTRNLIEFLAATDTFMKASWVVSLRWMHRRINAVVTVSINSFHQLNFLIALPFSDGLKRKSGRYREAFAQSDTLTCEGYPKRPGAR